MTGTLPRVRFWTVSHSQASRAGKGEFQVEQPSVPCMNKSTLLAMLATIVGSSSFPYLGPCRCKGKRPTTRAHLIHKRYDSGWSGSTVWMCCCRCCSGFSQVSRELFMRRGSVSGRVEIDLLTYGSSKSPVQKRVTSDASTSQCCHAHTVTRKVPGVRRGPSHDKLYRSNLITWAKNACA